MMSAPSFLRIAAAAAGCILAACAKPPAVTPGPASVTVALPLEHLVTDRDAYPGRFDAVDSVNVRPRVSGYIDSVKFQDGDLVHKGDLLFVIDPRPFAAAVTEARGRLAEARSQLVLANQELYVGNGRVIHNSGLAHGLRRGPVEDISLERCAHGHTIRVRRERLCFDRCEVVERACSRLGERCYRYGGLTFGVSLAASRNC
jgi:hypothetical protein